MGQSEMSIRTARYSVDSFCNRKYKLEDEQRSKVDINLFEQLIKQDSRLTRRCSVEQLECPHTTIERHLAALGES
jgi:acyl-ACP thioesterase